MKTIITKTVALAALVLLILAGSGCQKDDMRIFRHDPSEQTPSLSGKPTPAIGNFLGKIEVRLKDVGNASFGSVDLTFAGVALHYADERVGQNGWVYLNTKPRLVDILLYREGTGLFLAANSSLPMGTIDDVRVLFGHTNYVVWGDIKGRYKADLFLTKEVLPDVNIHLPVDLHRKMIVTLGINAARSIDRELADHYSFKPDLFLETIRFEDITPTP